MRPMFSRCLVFSVWMVGDNENINNFIVVIRSTISSSTGFIFRSQKLYSVVSIL